MVLNYRHPTAKILDALTEQSPGIYQMSAPLPVVWVTDPENVVKILADSDRTFGKRAVPPQIRFLLGDGTAASHYGGREEEWERLRPLKKEILKPLFALDGSGAISTTMENVLPFEDQTTSDVYSWCHDFFFALSWTSLFGCALSRTAMEANRTLRRTSVALAGAMRQENYFERSLDPETDDASPGFNSTLQKRRFALVALLSDLKADRPQSLAWRLNDFLSNEPDDSCDVALNFALTGVLLASYENAATTAAWSLWLLSQFPSEQEKVAHSVARGETENLEAVVNEALRLYSPIWSIARQCTAPALLNSRNHKTGTWFFISPWVQGRSSAGWENPLHFEPKRWRHEEVKRGFFLPFGNGPRRCPGEMMARTQIVAFLAALLRKWRFESLSDGCPPVALFGVTQRPKNGVHLKISRR